MIQPVSVTFLFCYGFVSTSMILFCYIFVKLRFRTNSVVFSLLLSTQFNEFIVQVLRFR